MKSSSSTSTCLDCAIDMESESGTAIAEQSTATFEETSAYTSTTEILAVYEEKKISEDWKGKPLSEMNNLFNTSCKELVKIEPGRTHTILFKVKY